MGKNTLFSDLFVSILKVEADAGINIPLHFLSQMKGKYINVTIPPNIATRTDTRGPILFQCCRVVLNEDKNRLELPKGEVVGRPVNITEVQLLEQCVMQSRGWLVYMHSWMVWG